MNYAMLKLHSFPLQQPGRWNCGAFTHNQTRSPQRRWASFSAKTFKPNPNGPNYKLVQNLQKKGFEDEKVGEQNVFRDRAFLRAIKTLDAFPDAIARAEQALELHGIGLGIARRVGEILHPGSDPFPIKEKKPKKDVSPEDAERRKVMLELMRLPGIGQVKARKLHDAGCRSLNDMRLPKYSETLSSSVRVGLDFVEHLDRRIPRNDIGFVQTALGETLSRDFEIHVVGSHRRAQPSSADIDIILLHPSYINVPQPPDKHSNPTKPSGQKGRSVGGRTSTSRSTIDAKTKHNNLLSKSVLEPLERAGLLAGTLSSGCQKWQGFIRMPINDEGSYQPHAYERLACIRDKAGSFARMDISLYPLPSKGAALLSSTGDSDFNSYMRTTASRMGLHLNEFGLWRWKEVMRLDHSSSVDDGSGLEAGNFGYWELLASETEEEIFEELGVEYVEPGKRNFSFVAVRSKDRRGKAESSD